MAPGFLILAVFFLALANGANDNFKGVATLWGSHRVGYRTALLWATVTTLAGSAMAFVLGSHLLATFSGRGIVPETLVGDPVMLLAVAVAAAATVLLATWRGLPISTTHALVGGLTGGGLALAGPEVRIGGLAALLLAPLLLSPLAALAATYLFYRIFRFLRLRLGLRRESCLCLGLGSPSPVMVREEGGPASATVLGVPHPGAPLAKVVVHREGCRAGLDGRLAGLEAQTLLDALHFLSAGALGFARGLNDTPKIVALLAAGAAFGIEGRGLFVALAMALGGLLAARGVARTLSREITPMNDGQGFSANFVTAFLVLLASRFGLPVSTTHVSVGSLFGLGAATGGGRRKVISGILLAWLFTLPLAGGIAALTAFLCRLGPS